MIAASLALVLLSGGTVWLARLGGPRQLVAGAEVDDVDSSGDELAAADREAPEADPYTLLMLMPPVKPMRPSTITILR